MRNVNMIGQKPNKIQTYGHVINSKNTMRNVNMIGQKPNKIQTL